MSDATDDARWTVGRLAREEGLSRSTLLYYDRIGLLRPTGRSDSNYRLYQTADRERLREVCFYRRIGVPLADIAGLVSRTATAGEPGRILRRRLQVLEHEIESRQQQQQEIVRLLEHLSKRRPPARQGGSSRPASVGRTGSHKTSPIAPRSKETTVINKQRWVAIMSAAGFSEAQMKQWHQTFEGMEPQAHEEFLESLGIGPDEIARIRAESRR